MGQIDEAQSAFVDNRDLYEMAREEGDQDSLLEAWTGLGRADEMVGKLEFRRMLGGAHDQDSALLSINAGAGGVDNQN